MRQIFYTALALIAVPAAASAQTEPAMKGPFYQIGESDSGVSVVAMGSRVRDGDMARITRVIILRESTKAGDLTVWRLDATAEYDCKRGLTRPLVLAARDEKGKLLHMFAPTEELGPTPAGDPTAPIALKVACDGKPSEGAVRFDDFNAWQTRFRAGG